MNYGVMILWTCPNTKNPKIKDLDTFSLSSIFLVKLLVVSR